MATPERTRQRSTASATWPWHSEAVWRSFVGNAPVFAVLIDDEDRIQYLNRAAPGLNVDDAIGRTVYEYLQPEYHETARRSIAQVRESAVPTSYECVGDGPNGHPAWYETHVGPVRIDGEMVAISLIAIDITQRKNAELQLQRAHTELEQQVAQRTAQLRESLDRLEQSETRYRALVESSPDAIIMMDLEGRLVFVSPRAAHMVGVQDPQELVGLEAAEFVAGKEQSELQQNLRRLVNEGVRENNEYLIVRRDGTQFPVESSSAVIRDSDGCPVALMAIFRDITERKEAYDALLRMMQANDRERELVTYELHDGVAQRILAALMHFEASAEAHGTKGVKASAMFNRGLTALHDALTEVRGLMNRTQVPVFGQFGMVTTIADFIDQLRDQPDTPEIVFDCPCPIEELDSQVETALFRVAQEAITNACQHSRATEIRVALKRAADVVVLEVQDNGIGFDIDAPRPKRFGLSGIRQRVRLLGKELHIDSTPGRGTRIRATFPIEVNGSEDSLGKTHKDVSASQRT